MAPIQASNLICAVFNILIVFFACLFLYGEARAKEPLDDEKFPSLELICLNVQETPVTLLLQDLKSRNISPQGRSGYILYEISAKVRRVYKGDLKKGERIRYRLTQEAGMRPPKPRREWFVSFNKDDAGIYFVPDNGYRFPYDKKLEKKYEACP